MNPTWWTSFLAWAAAINYAILLLAFLAYLMAHDGMYRLHRRWFELTRPQFDLSCYAFFGLYKLAIWFFLLVPLIVVCLMR
jgi:hypothetical protein